MKKSLASILLLAGAQAAFAAGGYGSMQVDSIIDTILQNLWMITTPISTIAFIWVAFQMFFRGATAMDEGRVCVAGVLIGASGWLSSTLIGA